MRGAEYAVFRHPLPEECPHRYELASIVPEAATQGFPTSHTVIRNLTNYFEALQDQES